MNLYIVITIVLVLILLSAVNTYLVKKKYRALCIEMEKQNEELAKASIKTVQALAGAVDAKDHYTRGHSWRVAEYSAMIAKELGLDTEQIEKIKYEAIMHDVGKIGIPDSVLNKGGKLSDVEYGMIKLHTTLGSEIISKIGSDKDAFAAARSHHERYDGKGYPDHLKGEEIPFNARIICVADSYDAMNSDRIYRKALPKNVIREEMIKGRGTQFDPKILDIFLKLFDEGIMNSIDIHARQDSVIVEMDEITYLLSDFLDMFKAKKEFKGDWDDEISKVGDVYNRLKKIAGKDDQYELSIIHIVAKDGVEVSAQKRQEAVEVMLDALKNTADTKTVCAQISQHQVVCLLPVKDGYNTATFMENVFLYYYKIIEVGDFEITYEIIEQ